MPDHPSGEGLNWIGWGDFFLVPKLIEQSPYPMAEVRHTVADTVMHMNLLRNGYGMSPMLAFCADVYPELEQVPGTELFLDRSIWLLLHSDLRSTSRVRRFVDFVAGALKEIRPLLQGDTLIRRETSEVQGIATGWLSVFVIVVVFVRHWIIAVTAKRVAAADAFYG